MNYTRATHNAEHSDGGYVCRFCTQERRAESIRLTWLNDQALYNEVRDLVPRFRHNLAYLRMRLRPVMYVASQQDRAASGLTGADSKQVLNMACNEAALQFANEPRVPWLTQPNNEQDGAA